MTKTDHELRVFSIQLEPRFKLRSYLRHLDWLIDEGGAYTKRSRLQGESLVRRPASIHASLPCSDDTKSATPEEVLMFAASVAACPSGVSTSGKMVLASHPGTAGWPIVRPARPSRFFIASAGLNRMHETSSLRKAPSDNWATFPLVTNSATASFSSSDSSMIVHAPAISN